MLVLGSSRRDRLGRVLPGAVTDRLLRGAPCAVAVAPKGFSIAEALGGPRLT
jgi:nucleotide-binding universal stress UspA family protein